MADTTYLVTARKYRPQLFKDVVAQEHVTETLKNAIRLDRLAHAYMFTGPRGVGKTTAARILAKAINCTTDPDEREDAAEPCRECVSCQSFEEGRNLNIIEIDAASNNKVDDVRDLRETVRIPPQGSRMKVYIVDEVHMLSNAAFNALLKTLEEPPPHALFIFATTEPHKVLPTIQSRCQRFDFRRIAIPETVERLEEICRAENISVDEESLLLISRKGDGALRDALSVFDQAVSLCGTDIHYDDLAQALGVVDADLYFDVAEATAAGDSGEMIRIVERIVGAGYDLYEFLDGLSEHLRNLLVASTLDDDSFLHTTEATRARIRSQADRFKDTTLLRLIQIVSSTSEQLKTSRQPRLHLEMALLRMAALPSSVDLTAALAKLDKLDRMADTGKLEVEVRSVGGVAARAPAPEQAAKSESGPAPKPDPADDEPPEPEPERDEPESAPGIEQSADSGASSGDADDPDDATNDPPPPPKPEPPVSDPQPTEASTDSADAEDDDSELSLFLDPPAISKKSGSNAAVAEGDDVAVLDPPSDVRTGTVETETNGGLEAAWNSVIGDIMEAEKQLGSFLRHTEVEGIRGHTVILGVPDDFHARALRADRARLAHRLTDAADVHVDSIEFKVRPELAATDGEEESGERDAREFLRTLCEENPAVRKLVERFGGEIVW